MQCRICPFDTVQRNALQNIVRNQFRANRHHESSRKIKLAFHAGYTALDLLDASAAGDADSTSRIEAYLSRIPSALTRLWKKPKPSPVDSRVQDPPPEKKFFNVFPRRSVPGVRRVPYMVDAQGVPFVRYGKPQPMNVSRVIRQKIEAYRKKTLYRHNLGEYWMPLARYEDKWDVLLARYGEYVQTDNSTFSSELWQEARRLEDALTEWTRRSTEMAAKMQEVVDREAELGQQEKEERRRLRQESARLTKQEGALDCGGHGETASAKSQTTQV